ncbi:hypothetical protein [Streptomyces canus]|uniref:hypothetical protein n=1 Tax=Streptomyces canus TaxID=58343 RepID=UPI0036E348BD
MATQDGGSGRPDDRDDTAPIPDAVWQRFLEDTERAIHESAPKEPSARERVARAGIQPLDAWRRAEEDGYVRGRTDEDRVEPVGELWQPDDSWIGPAWRDMDPRTRRRRIVRVLGAVVAVVVVLVAMSTAPSGRDSDSETYSDATLEETQETPEGLATSTPPPDGKQGEVLPEAP